MKESKLNIQDGTEIPVFVIGNQPLTGPIGHKGEQGWRGEQETYAGEMVLPEDMVRGRLYKVEGVGVARFVDEYDDFLFQMRHHEVYPFGQSVC